MADATKTPAGKTAQPATHPATQTAPKPTPPATPQPVATKAPGPVAQAMAEIKAESEAAGGKKAGGKKKAEKAKPKAKPKAKARPEKRIDVEALRSEFAEKWKQWPQKVVPIDSIGVDERYRKNKDPQAIEDLAHSINQHGLLNPPSVKEAEPGKYRLIAGEQRLEACKALKLTEIPVRIVSPENEAEALAMELEENLRRKDPSMKETIEGIKRFETVIKSMPKELVGGGRYRFRQMLTAATGVSHETRRKIKVVEAAAKQDPEQFGGMYEKLKNDKTTPDVAYKYVIEKRRQVADDAGVPIHPKVAKAFEGADTSDNAVKLAASLAKEVNDLCNFPGGERLVKSGRFRVKTGTGPDGKPWTKYVFDGLDGLSELLALARPYCQCPVCYLNAGKKLGVYQTSCKACQGAGHVSKETFDALKKSGDEAYNEFIKEASLEGLEATPAKNSDATKAERPLPAA